MHRKIARSSDEFFNRLEAQCLSVTYADVMLRSGYSEVMPDNVDISTVFSKNTPLNIPIVSAAMDTVTEAELAIAIAKLGGLGVIHKNLSTDEQASEVGRVKFHLNGLIEKPICFRENDTIEQIIQKKEEKKWEFSTFPIVNSSDVLVGLLTDNDFKFPEKTNVRVKKVMTDVLITGKKDTTIKEAYRTLKENKKGVLPLVDESGKIAGMYVFKDVKRIILGDNKSYNVDIHGNLRVAAAIGVYDDAFKRVEKLKSKRVDVVVIDTAHGDSKPVLETLKKLKKMNLPFDIVVGNISEPGSAERLCDAGADGIKVGQGPGGICTTRLVAGIGAPQITAVYECSKVAERYGIPVCADGGLKYSGDIAKAIGAGAHSVMMGSMLAGTTEAPGKIVRWDGREWKSYRGMGSLGAMESNKGSRERYNQEKTGKSQLIAEGVEGRVPFKGNLSDVITQYVGGLRRGMGYVSAENIEELRQKANFRRVTDAGQEESHPHVALVKEPPNYSIQGAKK